MNNVKQKVIIYFLLFLMTTMFISYFIIFSANETLKHKNNIISIINRIKILNYKLDSLIFNNLFFTNYDGIVDNFNQFELLTDDLELEINKIDKNVVIFYFNNFKNNIEIKNEYIEDYKSNIALFNNSLIYLLDLKKHFYHEEYYDKNVSILFDDLLNSLIKITINKSINLNEIYLKKALLIQYSNDIPSSTLILFDKHLKIALSALEEIKECFKFFQSNEILETVELLEEHLHQYFAKLESKNFLFIYILISLNILFIILLIYYFNEYKKNEHSLIQFKEAVEKSDNLILITNANKEIEYVNEAFENIMGYKKHEIIGKKPAYFRSGIDNLDFYNKLNETINSGKKWSGEIINKDKHGNLIYERCSIIPIYNDGKIDKYLSIKLDISSEKKYQKDLESLNNNLQIKVDEELKKSREKDMLLIQKSRSLAMAQMIANIAHHWRQPLNSIGLILQNMQEYFEDGLLDKELMEKFSSRALNQITELSKTIDNFRNFFKVDKLKEYFYIKTEIINAIDIVSGTFSDLDIIVNISGEDFEILSFKHELQQIIVNVLNNSKDSILEKRVMLSINFEGIININIIHNNNSLILDIKDNGTGVNDKILSNIFDPYFSTKEQGKGVGLGLYIVKMIVENSLNGSIEVKNIENGFLFRLIIPINS
ncbi:MAG: PAS domain S-box protein [Campylobacterales bacterium]|nr:PAS domain S-box protein [Campylobacterales bacterium]